MSTNARLCATLDLRDPDARKALEQLGGCHVLTLTVIGQDGAVEHLHLAVEPTLSDKRVTARIETHPSNHYAPIRPWFTPHPDALTTFLQAHDPAGSRRLAGPLGALRTIAEYPDQATLEQDAGTVLRDIAREALT